MRIKSESLGVEARHYYILKLPQGFYYAAKLESHWFRTGLEHLALAQNYPGPPFWLYQVCTGGERAPHAWSCLASCPLSYGSYLKAGDSGCR